VAVVDELVDDELVSELDDVEVTEVGGGADELVVGTEEFPAKGKGVAACRRRSERVLVKSKVLCPVERTVDV
jgi:hypothetical protein